MTALRTALATVDVGRLTPHRPDLRRTFRSLRGHNFRLYISGQAVSLTGTWMQRLGQEWLVLHLTGSGSWLGIVAALQFLPLLAVGPWGGLFADRVDKRRMLLVTQSAAGVLAAVLGVVTLTGVVQVWMVLALALALGLVTALDNPTRQAFVVEMVGRDDVANAVALNSVMVNAARAVGPALAGLLIAATGMAPTFLFNALSYGVVVVALVRMDGAQLQRAAPASRAAGQLRQGFAYVARTPSLRTPLLLMLVVGMLAYEFSVTLPLLARYAFAGNAATLGWLNSALGVGAVIGGLAMAGRETPTDRWLDLAAFGFGALLLVTALAPTLWLAVVLLIATGALSIAFLASANALLQLRSDPAYRGRVMSLWAIAFLGTTPIGAPLVGWLSQVAGPRAGLAAGGLATAVAGLVAHLHDRDAAGAPARRGDSTTNSGRSHPTTAPPATAPPATAPPTPAWHHRHRSRPRRSGSSASAVDTSACHHGAGVSRHLPVACRDAARHNKELG